MDEQIKESPDFRHIPRELQPKSADHIDYDPVFRGVKNTALLTVEDFLPSNIEYANQQRTFNQSYQGNYSVSVFTDKESLVDIIEKYPAMKKSIKAIAKGKTTIKRGISTKEKEHHVYYFLYDYENNSPKEDFVIVDVL